MNIVYEPRGRAKEYSDLACNLYMGCSHGCKYCFAPACMRKTSAVWHSNIYPRKNALLSLEKDAALLNKRNDQRAVLFCFLSDPYQPLEKKEKLTHQALKIMRQYQIKSKILTKGCCELIEADLPLMKEAGTEFGITICFTDDSSRQNWEPEAAPISDRFEILKKAHAAGIYTWVSLEPVIDPQQALEVIRQGAPYVDKWKIGKLNHMKDEESKVDWLTFREEAESLLTSLNADYYIKDDLRKIKA
jgi:DNA repair photolyase